MPRLITPDVRVRESFLAALGEAAERSVQGRPPPTAEGFARFVADLRADEHAPSRPGLVPQTTWWWVDGVGCPEYIGRIAVRHRLTDHLRRLGGHIGYDVRPSRRREGHGTAMLAAVLPFVDGLGIDPALVTCDATNLASRRVIERNGGILAEESDGVLRFWVPTG
jgi:predicted acetyltransferase